MKILDYIIEKWDTLLAILSTIGIGIKWLMDRKTYKLNQKKDNIVTADEAFERLVERVETMHVNYSELSEKYSELQMTNVELTLQLSIQQKEINKLKENCNE